MEPTRFKFMRAVLNEIGHDALVLKGGSALVIAYGLDRSTGDLDFDSSRKIRNIESKIRKAALPDVKITAIDVLKDTDTVQRYRVSYESPYGANTLKIEISYRKLVPESEVAVVEGIRVARLATILDQKLSAAHDGPNPRTKARDLYDLDFIARSHPEVFTNSLSTRLAEFASDPSGLEERYAPAFAEEPELIEGLDALILRLFENSKILKTKFTLERGPSVDLDNTDA